MVLFGSSLFPLYVGPPPAEAALPRIVATAIAYAMLVAAFVWLLWFSAALGEPENTVEAMRTVLFESGFGPAWLVRLSGAGLALAAALAGGARLVIPGGVHAPPPRG